MAGAKTLQQTLATSISSSSGEKMKTEGSQCGQTAEAISSARLLLDSAGLHFQLSPQCLS